MAAAAVLPAARPAVVRDFSDRLSSDAGEAVAAGAEVAVFCLGTGGGADGAGDSIVCEHGADGRCGCDDVLVGLHGGCFIRAGLRA